MIPKVLPYKGWTPMKDGVSQSLLQKFVGDADRFHKAVVEGLRPTDRKEAMEFGTIFHKLIELGAKMGSKYTRQKLVTVMTAYMKKHYPTQESALLCRIAIAQFHEYRKWEAEKEKYKYIAQEPIFCEPFPLPPLHFEPNEQIRIKIPAGITIPLRGRIDEVIENNGMWIQENKTKSKIDISHIQDTLHANIQVMFYAICAELKYGRPCKGVVYNVIRKPGQRQRQKESDNDFIKRIVADIEDNPAYYFYRLKYEFAPGMVKTWQRESLLPLLYKVYLWWKSIEKNPTNPWMDENGNVNPFHGRKPFGIYDSMSTGKGDFYNLIVYGRKTGLVKVSEMFPELQDEDDD
jgi:hypothetical protein